jgi:MoaA/NifB/PqqE/SkfB family radical SAM enzyme
MIASDIKWLHVELSSKCNAWCPACPRNKNGYGLADGLVEQDLPTGRFNEIIDQLPCLTSLQLCGNYGDPIAASNILEVIDIAKQRNLKIQIHTNGSLRSTNWWAMLGENLSGVEHDVWFGLDGIDSIHEIYRQGTSYKKVIENAQAFIKAGGYATWQFIPYAHNEHQIIECIKTSQQIGFKKFKFVKMFRNKLIVKDYRSGKEFELAPPTNVQKMIRMPGKKSKVAVENCMYLSQPSIYLSASGKLSTCCYFGVGNGVDTIQEVLYNKLDLSHDTCLNSCGT